MGLPTQRQKITSVPPSAVAPVAPPPAAKAAQPLPPKPAAKPVTPTLDVIETFGQEMTDEELAASPLTREAIAKMKAGKPIVPPAIPLETMAAVQFGTRTLTDEQMLDPAAAFSGDERRDVGDFGSAEMGGLSPTRLVGNTAEIVGGMSASALSAAGQVMQGAAEEGHPGNAEIRQKMADSLTGGAAAVQAEAHRWTEAALLPELAEASKDLNVREHMARVLEDEGVRGLIAKYNGGTEGDSQKFLGDRSKFLVNQATGGTMPEDPEERTAITKRAQAQALKELAYARMGGAWTGPAFMPRPPERSAPFAPSIELVGLDDKGNFTTRQRSVPGYILDEIGQSVGTAITATGYPDLAARAAFGTDEMAPPIGSLGGVVAKSLGMQTEDGPSFSAGLRARKWFSDVAKQTDPESDFGRVVAVGAGGLADVFVPTPLHFIGPVAKLAKRAVSTSDAAAMGKMDAAIRAADLAGESAHAEAAARLADETAALLPGGFDDAIRLSDEERPTDSGLTRPPVDRAPPKPEPYAIDLAAERAGADAAAKAAGEYSDPLKLEVEQRSAKEFLRQLTTEARRVVDSVTKERAPDGSVVMRAAEDGQPPRVVRSPVRTVAALIDRIDQHLRAGTLKPDPKALQDVANAAKAARLETFATLNRQLADAAKAPIEHAAEQALGSTTALDLLESARTGADVAANHAAVRERIAALEDRAAPSGLSRLSPAAQADAKAARGELATLRATFEDSRVRNFNDLNEGRIVLDEPQMRALQQHIESITGEPVNRAMLPKVGERVLVSEVQRIDALIDTARKRPAQRSALFEVVRASTVTERIAARLHPTLLSIMAGMKAMVWGGDETAATRKAGLRTEARQWKIETERVIDAVLADIGALPENRLVEYLDGSPVHTGSRWRPDQAPLTGGWNHYSQFTQAIAMGLVSPAQLEALGLAFVDAGRASEIPASVRLDLQTSVLDAVIASPDAAGLMDRLQLIGQRITGGPVDRAGLRRAAGMIGGNGAWMPVTERWMGVGALITEAQRAVLLDFNTANIHGGLTRAQEMRAGVMQAKRRATLERVIRDAQANHDIAAAEVAGWAKRETDAHNAAKAAAHEAELLENMPARAKAARQIVLDQVRAMAAAGQIPNMPSAHVALAWTKDGGILDRMAHGLVAEGVVPDLATFWESHAYQHRKADVLGPERQALDAAGEKLAGIIESGNRATLTWSNATTAFLEKMGRAIAERAGSEIPGEPAAVVALVPEAYRNHIRAEMARIRTDLRDIPGEPRGAARKKAVLDLLADVYAKTVDKVDRAARAPLEPHGEAAIASAARRMMPPAEGTPASALVTPLNGTAGSADLTAYGTPRVVKDAQRNSYGVRLKLVPVEAPLTSHVDGTNDWTPGYTRELQNRPDATARDEQLNAWSLALDPDFLNPESADLTSGPPVVWRDGVGNDQVIAGNGRTWMIRRALARNDAAAARYRAHVDKAAEVLGLEKPAGHTGDLMLVREARLAADDLPGAILLANNSQSSHAASMAKIDEAISRTVAARAVLDGEFALDPKSLPLEMTADAARQMLDENPNSLGAALRAMYPEASARAALDGDGVKLAVQSALLLALDNVTLARVRQAGGGTAERVMNAMPAIMKLRTIAGEKPSWAMFDVSRTMGDALDLLESARAHGKAGSPKAIAEHAIDMRSQMPMHGGRVIPVSAPSTALAIALEAGGRAQGERPELAFARRMNALVGDAEGLNQVSMFGPAKTPLDVMTESLAGAGADLVRTLPEDHAVAQARAIDLQQEGRRQVEASGGAARLFQQTDRPLAPTFYSGLRSAVDAIPQEKMSVEQLRAMLKKSPGVKQDEIDWTRLDFFLADKKAITKAEVIGWLDENAVRVEEKVLGDGGSARWTGPEPTAKAIEDLSDQLFEGLSREDRTGPKRALPRALESLATDMRLAEYEAKRTESSPDFVGTLLRWERDSYTRPEVVQEVYAVLGGRLERATKRDGPTQYESYKTPGGTNYRELLFTLPAEKARGELPPGVELQRFDAADGDPAIWEARWRTPEGHLQIEHAPGTMTREEATATLNRAIERRAGTPDTAYRAPHFGEHGRNLLAHTRLSDRVGPNGEKILMVDEVQSDLHQAGREKGYAPTPDEFAAIEAEHTEALARRDQAQAAFDKATARSTGPTDPDRVSARVAVEKAQDEANAISDRWNSLHDRKREGVPAAPFSKTWHELVMKRLFREAAEGGYDGIAWTKGVQQVDRYTDATRQRVDEIRWERGVENDPTIHLEKAVAKAQRDLNELEDAGADRDTLREARLDRDRAREELDAAQQGRDAPRGWGAVSALGPNEVRIRAVKDGRPVHEQVVPITELPGLLGKDMAERIVKASEATPYRAQHMPEGAGDLPDPTWAVLNPDGKVRSTHATKTQAEAEAQNRNVQHAKTPAGTLSGPDLTIGGEGMKAFYDRMLASFANDYAKKNGWGTRVEETTVDADGKPIPMHYLPLTPTAREQVLYKGQRLFQKKEQPVDPAWLEGAKWARDELARRKEAGESNVHAAVRILDTAPRKDTSAYAQGVRDAMNKPAMVERQLRLLQNQEDGGVTKGYIDIPAGRISKDAKALITLTQHADLSTLFHENGHLMRRLIGQAEGSGVVLAAEWKALDAHATQEFGGWNTAAEEWFARQFEAYLATGALEPKAAASLPEKVLAAIRDVFQHAARVLTRIYTGPSGAGTLPDVHPKAKVWFDRVMQVERDLAEPVRPAPAVPPVDGPPASPPPGAIGAPHTPPTPVPDFERVGGLVEEQQHARFAMDAARRSFARTGEMLWAESLARPKNPPAPTPAERPHLYNLWLNRELDNVESYIAGPDAADFAARIGVPHLVDHVLPKQWQGATSETIAKDIRGERKANAAAIGPESAERAAYYAALDAKRPPRGDDVPQARGSNEYFRWLLTDSDPNPSKPPRDRVRYNDVVISTNPMDGDGAWRGGSWGQVKGFVETPEGVRIQVQPMWTFAPKAQAKILRDEAGKPVVGADGKNQPLLDADGKIIYSRPAHKRLPMGEPILVRPERVQFAERGRVYRNESEVYERVERRVHFARRAAPAVGEGLLADAGDRMARLYMAIGEATTPETRLAAETAYAQQVGRMHRELLLRPMTDAEWAAQSAAEARTGGTYVGKIRYGQDSDILFTGLAPPPKPSIDLVIGPAKGEPSIRQQVQRPRGPEGMNAADVVRARFEAEADIQARATPGGIVPDEATSPVAGADAAKADAGAAETVPGAAETPTPVRDLDAETVAAQAAAKSAAEFHVATVRASKAAQLALDSARQKLEKARATDPTWQPKRAAETGAAGVAATVTPRATLGTAALNYERAADTTKIPRTSAEFAAGKQHSNTAKLLNSLVPEADRARMFAMRDLLNQNAWVPASVRDAMGSRLQKLADRALEESNWTALVAISEWKQAVTRGSITTNPKYFWNNVPGDFEQIARQLGFEAAIRTAIRQDMQNVLAIPGVSNVAGGTRAAEGIRRAIQSGSEGALTAVDLLMQRAGNRLEVNTILDGGSRTGQDVMVLLGGKPHSARNLRDVAVRGGVFDGFDVAELHKNLTSTADSTFTGLLDTLTQRKAIQDISEGIGTRKRVGLYTTLIEMGYTPEAAAKGVVDALYDYKYAMSEGDKNALVKVMLPFWAWQKNANRQMLSALVSPAGFYRVKILYQAKKVGTNLVTGWLDTRDDYGVQADQMAEDDGDLRIAYDELIRQLRAKGLDAGEISALLNNRDLTDANSPFSWKQWGPRYGIDARRIEEMTPYCQADIATQPIGGFYTDRPQIRWYLPVDPHGSRWDYDTYQAILTPPGTAEGAFGFAGAQLGFMANLMQGDGAAAVSRATAAVDPFRAPFAGHALTTASFKTPRMAVSNTMGDYLAGFGLTHLTEGGRVETPGKLRYRYEFGSPLAYPVFQATPLYALDLQLQRFEKARTKDSALGVIEYMTGLESPYVVPKSVVQGESYDAQDRLHLIPQDRRAIGSGPIAYPLEE